MQIAFTLPTQNVSGIDRIDLEHIEVHAITVGPGGIVPPVRQFLTRRLSSRRSRSNRRRSERRRLKARRRRKNRPSWIHAPFRVTG